MSLNIDLHCNLYNWIDSIDQDLAWVIRHLCLDYIISTPKQGGVTFLRPDKKSDFYATVIKTVNDNPNGFEKLLKSMVLPIYLPDPNSFNKTSIGNKLGIKMSVKSVDKSGTIKFENGLELVIDKSFKPSDKIKGRTCAYTIVSGSTQMEGERYVMATVGANEIGMVKPFVNCNHPTIKLMGRYRALFAQAIELVYEKQLQFTTKPTPYAVAVLLLLEHIKDKGIDLYYKIKTLLDSDPIISFYILFEPYKTTGTNFLSDDIVSDKLLKSIIASDNLNDHKVCLEYEAYLSIQNLSPPSSLTYLDPIKASSTRNEIRESLLIDDISVLDLREKVISIYNSISYENRTDGKVENILPDSLTQHYNLIGNDSKMLWQDELRHNLSENLEYIKMISIYKHRINAFVKLCNDMKILYPGDDYPVELIVFKKLGLESINKVEAQYSMKYFIKSRKFLHNMDSYKDHCISIKGTQSKRDYNSDSSNDNEK